MRSEMNEHGNHCDHCNGMWGHRSNRGWHLVAKILILAIVFWLGMQLGELRAYTFGGFGPGMMGGWGYGGMMDGGGYYGNGYYGGGYGQGQGTGNTQVAPKTSGTSTGQ